MWPFSSHVPLTPSLFVTCFWVKLRALLLLVLFGISFGASDSCVLYLLQVQILKRLQRQAFYDIMQLRERQEKVERVISLFKATKVGPFAEESTRVKGVVNVAGSLPRDISEAESCISSRFVFEAPVRKKDSLFAELSTEHRYVSQENDHIETPFVLSKLMYLSNISDSFSVAVVPKGARCKDFSMDQNIREVISSDEQRCLQYYHFAC